MLASHRRRRTFGCVSESQHPEVKLMRGLTPSKVPRTPERPAVFKSVAGSRARCVIAIGSPGVVDCS